MNNRGNKFSKIKYEEKMTNEINFSLRRDFSDPRLQHVSITHVELNKDYSTAKVYWDTFEKVNRGEIKKAIDSIKGRMRSLLAEKLSLRHMPELNFYYNSQYEDELNISTLLQHKVDEEN